MDLINKAAEFVRKYRYAVLVLLVGIVLMVLPTNKSESTEEISVEVEEETVELSQQLEQILSTIHGVGKVRVLLSIDKGPQTLYQNDTNASGSDTVVITDTQRAQYGLVQQVLPETYRGAIIVCQGADNDRVCLAVVEAVAKVTGLSSDKISVLKMK